MNQRQRGRNFGPMIHLTYEKRTGKEDITLSDDRSRNVKIVPFPLTFCTQYLAYFVHFFLFPLLFFFFFLMKEVKRREEEEVEVEV